MRVVNIPTIIIFGATIIWKASAEWNSVCEEIKANPEDGSPFQWRNFCTCRPLSCCPLARINSDPCVLYERKKFDVERQELKKAVDACAATPATASDLNKDYVIQYRSFGDNKWETHIREYVKPTNRTVAVWYAEEASRLAGYNTTGGLFNTMWGAEIDTENIAKGAPRYRNPVTNSDTEHATEISPLRFYIRDVISAYGREQIWSMASLDEASAARWNAPIILAKAGVIRLCSMGGQWRLLSLSIYRPAGSTHGSWNSARLKLVEPGTSSPPVFFTFPEYDRKLEAPYSKSVISFLDTNMYSQTAVNGEYCLELSMVNPSGSKLYNVFRFGMITGELLG